MTTYPRRTVLAGGVFATAVATFAGRGIAFAAPETTGGTALVAAGRPQAAIVIPAGASGDEALAAKELADHVEQMSGVRLPIGTEPVPGLVPVYLGAACPDPRRDDIPDDEGTGHAFRIEVTAGRIQLCGAGDSGTLFAVSEVLEGLGVRWLMPGPYGTVVPRRATVQVAHQDRIEVPTYWSRQLHFVDNYLSVTQPGVDPKEGVDWARRHRLRGTSWNAHGIPLLPPASKTREPELFIRENGVVTNQLDVTHPEVLRRAIASARQQLDANPSLPWISMGPADGHGFGVTEWDADSWDTLSGLPSVTDRYVRFFNLVLDDLQVDHPDVGIAFFSYDNYMLPPVKEVPNRRIIPALAPINVDRLHTAAEPAGHERRYALRLADRWRSMVDAWSYRGYLFNLADPGLPFVPIAAARDEIPLFLDHGSKYGCRMEVSASWGYDAPAFYLATKLMWDRDRDPAAVLGEFMTAAYGPAAATMADYYDTIVQLVGRAPVVTGRWLGHLTIFTAQDFSLLDGTLAAAERIAAATDDVGIVGRVRVARLAFMVGWSAWRTIDAWHHGHFSVAAQAMQEAYQSFAVAVSHKPVALYPLRQRFLDLIKPGVDQAHLRTSGANQLVTLLPDSLPAILDSTGEGLDDQLFAVDVPAVGWRELSTRLKSSSDQGLSYFRGSYWYRTTLKIDQAWAGRALTLFLGSVDESARAWVNGNELPLVAGAGSFKPREFDLSGVLRFDGTDLLVLNVLNKNLNELGTGGLVGPALVWAGGEVAPGVAKSAVSRGSGHRDLAGPGPVPVPVSGHRLPSQWFAKLDPAGDCAMLGLWEKAIPTSSMWLPRDTRRSIATQGLGYYRGGLVERIDTDIPALAGPGRLFVPSRSSKLAAWLDDVPLAADGANGDVHRFVVPRGAGGRRTLVVATLDSPGAGLGGIHGTLVITT